MRGIAIAACLGPLALLAVSNPSLAQGVAADTRAARLAPWADFVAEAAQKTGLPAAWIDAVLLAESGGQTVLNGQPTTSPKGAMGLMQLMPATYAALKVQLNLGNDPFMLEAFLSSDKGFARSGRRS